MSLDATSDPVQQAVDHAVNVAGSVWDKGVALGAQLRLPGLKRQHRGRVPSPGSAPGLESLPESSSPPTPDACQISVMDWSPERVETKAVNDLDDFLNTPKPDWVTVRWINVNGLHPYVIERFRRHFDFHSLAAEDVLFVPQRPKVEAYEDHLFVIARMLTKEEQRLMAEQISFFLFKDILLTFQEHPGDIWEPIRNRILQTGSKLRGNGSGYLLYALIDAVVDNCFPILEGYGDYLEELEDAVVHNPAARQLQQIHGVKRQLSLLRRVLWPTRDMVDQLYRDQDDFFAASTAAYFRDVYDHAVQVIDIIETYRELAGSLTDLYMSSVSNRMNEVMKVLTIMASLFIPITFLAGVYGMNFEYIPELKWRYAYPAFWGVTILVTGGLLIFFHRKRWL